MIDQRETQYIRRAWLILGVALALLWGVPQNGFAAPASQTITGYVQNADLRRVAQATVELRDKEGTLVTSATTTDAGGFLLITPREGVFSVQAVQDTYHSEHVVIEISQEAPAPVVLTLTETKEIALEIVEPLVPIKPNSSGETYSVSRKDIEALSRGNNVDLHDVLLTIPSAVYGSLKQVHIRQDHANLQFRIDGVPIPDTVTSQFSDLLSPRAWERADILLGGMEAQYGNRTTAVIDITSKSGTKPGFGSIGVFGGSNETVLPSFEYGGTAGDKFRYYVMNNYKRTNRAIDPPTLGQSIYHGDGESNQTFLRGDYQIDNRNNLTLLLLNSVADSQIPTEPGQEVNDELVPLIRSTPGLANFTPAPSEQIDENQVENNQYSHLVWRHDMSANQFVSVAGYFRHSRATFTTDPYNVLAYTSEHDHGDEGEHGHDDHDMHDDHDDDHDMHDDHDDHNGHNMNGNGHGHEEEPFSASASDQDRWGYAGGIRLDYTHAFNSRHMIKAGFQLDRTTTRNKTRIFAFRRGEADDHDMHDDHDDDHDMHDDHDDDHDMHDDHDDHDMHDDHDDHGHGEPVGGVINRNANRRVIGYREEFWIQDQYTPNDQWTINLGLRLDNIHGYIEAFQVSPRIGVTYAPNKRHAFRAFYGRLFTPPNLEALPFLALNLEGTTAEPEDDTNIRTKPERSHYFEIGSTHAIGRSTVIQLTGYHKYSTNMADAHQFQSTPMLNYFAFERGWQQGIDFSVKTKLSNTLTARGNVAWGRCKGFGLQSGHFLLHGHELRDIQLPGGTYCDHSQDITSSAVVTYRPFTNTTITAQMFFGSGLRSAEEGQRTNSGNEDSNTTYNLSLTQVFPFAKKQKLLLAVDVVNLFDQQEFLNTGEQSVGLGVSHANMPRSVFFRAQWFF